MNGPSGTMSPVSVDGSDWSGINQYNKTDPPFSPTHSTRSNLATPPTSGVPSGSSTLEGIPNGAPGPVSDAGNPSPPSSVAARSSDGTLPDRAKRQKRLEEILGQHYVALRRFLQGPYREDRLNSKSNKARDKLLRLSPTQFHELSTDVYDELLRRQQAMPSPARPPRPDVPPFLPPRKEFHEKRNQARKKLASLQHQRFRDLATDVYTELERRFPQFPARDASRAVSPAPSFRGRPPPTPTGFPPNGFPPPGPGGRNSQNRGPPRYPPGGMPPASPMRYPPRQGSLGGPPPGMNGDGPTAKSFQSNTIVPNKSTMVEDDDDAAGTEDDYDARSDAFALDVVLNSRRGTGTTLGDGDRKMLAETQSQVSFLQEKVTKLEELLKLRDQEISHYQEDESKVGMLEELVKSKDAELSKYQEEQDKSQISLTERQEWEDVKTELESKITQAEDLNNSLQQELEKVRTEQQAMEMELRSQIDQVSRQSTGDAELQAKFSNLEIKHQSLQTELLEQQKVTEEVRREAAGFLVEMRALSEQSHTKWEQEERLTTEVHRLEEEVKQWKARYAKAKTQLRQRTSSIGISDLRPDAASVAQENEFTHETGVIMDVHVTKFQISIDELLRIAREDNCQLVMQQIKAVVVAVRHILHDVDLRKDSNEELSALSTKATRKVSATANNMITATKNFASSAGLSPLSLLDAAASHLSSAVIGLIRIVKIRPTPADELNDAGDDEAQVAQMKSPHYFSVAPSQGRLSRNDSIYSAMSPPAEHDLTSPGMNAGMHTMYPVQSADHELHELKYYLEDQTDGLVQSIQALVASIRAEQALNTISTHISAISSVVSQVTSSTQHYINSPEVNLAVRERASPIIETLQHHRDRLTRTAAEGEEVSDLTELRAITNKLPPIAFEIARETKELVHRLDPHDLDEEEDDFR
ncbi:putative cell polarity protein [Aspergillus saccharolyticus JOP 1030-1]|uniref:Putative cell polarity protein n=1 Tax=Aspergillus saccharolyticus JOP 1030-1 TaxID=1450539 RepID=A0A318ZPY9_9EURO|nr:putative cell polarity protein [Aspergillus saccharolyticus JOP 1030-1]PYH49097.1 putative cell polarity protein [Aspergillus saccharolyticus JOP 1030-1]